MPIKNLRGPQIQVTSMNYFYLGRVCGNNIKKKHSMFRATRWSDIRFHASDHIVVRTGPWVFKSIKAFEQLEITQFGFGKNTTLSPNYRVYYIEIDYIKKCKCGAHL